MSVQAKKNIHLESFETQLYNKLDYSSELYKKNNHRIVSRKIFQELLRSIYFIIVILLSTTAYAAERPFAVKYQTNDTGDIAIIGNALASCSESDRTIVNNEPLQWDAGSCTSVQAGNPPTYTGTSYDFGYANNYWNMYNVNADTGAGRTNSSSSTLSIPAGSEVLWAGLYWGGDASTVDSTISFKTPITGYQTITAAGSDFSGTDYQSYAVVTSLVDAAGSGTYWGADVDFREGQSDSYAAWSLVVVYKNASLPFRNLTVYDGYRVVYNGNNVDITLSGFLTPATGPVTATLGAVTYEGDSTAYVNDQLLIDGSALSDAQNPLTDYFNSSVSFKGSRVTTKTPDFVNQMAYDADIIDASSAIGNSVSSTTMTFTTSGDVYFPGVATMAIDIYVPDLKSSFVKTIDDVNGGDLVPGDILEYTIEFTNTGLDGADEVIVTDPLLGPTTYLPNSISITTTDTDPSAVSGSMSDSSGNDAAEYVSGTKTIIARLGRGANSTSGGLIPASVNTALKFRVTVNPDSHGQNISNTANIDYMSQTLGTSYMDSGLGSIDVDVMSLIDAIDDNPTSIDSSTGGAISSVVANDSLNSTLNPTIGTNSGDVSLNSTGTAQDGITTLGLDTTPATGSIIMNAEGIITVAAGTTAGSYTYTYEICEVLNPTNCDTAVATVLVTIDLLVLNKSVASLTTDADNSTDVTLGDTLTYTITATNDGNTTLNNVVISDPNLTPSSFSCLTLAPNADCVLTGTHVVNTSEAEAGEVVNIAGVVSDEIVTSVPSNEVTTTVEIDPSYNMVKTSDSATIIAPGTINYTFTFTNTGNIVLSNLNITDPNAVVTGCPIATLAVGASDSCTGTRVVTQAQIDAGVAIVNTATPSAEDPSGAAAPEDNTADNTTTTTVEQTPSYNMVKTSDSATISAPGTIDYTFTFTNTGNVALSNLDIDDPDAVVTGCPIATLAVGASDSCTGTRVITQSQIDAGVDITNTATPSAEDPLGTAAPEDNTADNTTTTTVEQTPSYNMVKTSDSATMNAPGTINYTFTFTNTGNVALSNLDIDDPDAVVTGCPIATLAVGVSDSCTGTRVITQSQIDAGVDIINTATPSAEDPSGAAAPEDNTADNMTTTAIHQDASFNMVKTSDSATMNAPGTINYTFTFTNTGNVVLSDLDIDDPNAVVTGCPIATLAVGASDSCTGTRVITQAQIDAGVAIPNTATPSAEDPLGTAAPEDNTADNTTTTAIHQDASFNMVKTSDSATMNAPGTINYTFSFTNTGNVTLSNLDIDDPDAVVAGCPIASLAVGASESCTGTRVITQAQIDAGAAILNTATPSAEDPSGTAAPEDNTVDNTATTAIHQDVSFNMVKTSDSATMNAPGTINYTFTFTNTGNVVLSNLAIDDPDAVVTGCPIATLAVGASDSCTGTRVITQAQIDAGVDITNTAIPSAEDPSGAAAPEDNTADNMTTTAIHQDASFNMVKTSDSATMNAPGTINYTFTFTNTGNVALSNLDIDDPNAVVTGCPIATLAVGASDSCTGTRVITQAQIDAGVDITNTAIPSAEDPSGAAAPEDNTADNMTTTAIHQDASFNMVKTSDSATMNAPGTINYTFTFTNTGNVALSNLDIDDPDAVVTGCPITTLAVGASDSCTGTRVITQAQIDAGVDITNTATPSAEDPLGTAATEDNTADNATTTTVDQTPSYNMVKTSDSATINAPGTINYTFTFTNTGNVALSNLDIDDPNAVVTGCPIATLAVGASDSCLGTRVITQAQIDAGVDITNTAIPSAEDTLGNPMVEDNSVDNTTVTAVHQDASFNMVKTSDSATISAPGTINYTFTFTNTGNVGLSNLDIDDQNAVVTGCPIATLAVGASESCTGTREVTQAQIDAGISISNTATPSAEDPSGVAVSEDNTVDNTTTTSVHLDPSYNMVKTSNIGTISAPGTINYTFTFTNTGNVVLNNLDINDPDAVVTGCPITTLGVGATASCTGTRTITQAQINEGTPITNTAIPSAEYPLGNSIPEDNTTDNTATTAIHQDASFNMVKTSNSATINAPGTINYTFTFTNTGNVVLNNLDIDDPDAVVTGCPIATLAVGASDSCSGTRVITQAQIDTGVAILNTATPSAKDPSGASVPEDNTADNTSSTGIHLDPSYNMVKTSDMAAITGPGTINYTFTFTNTGNVALSNLDITDPDAVVSGCPIATLAVGASDSCTGTRVITQAQIDAGVTISNTAIPNVEYPLGTSIPEDNSVDNTATTIVTQTPAFNMVKTSDSATISAPGTINYTFTFTNTGNVALSNLDIDDPNAILTGCPIATLAVGASDSCTGTRVITQAQIDAGTAILNTAMPSAEDPSGTAAPEDNTADNTTTTTVDQTPSFNMVKTSNSATISAPGTINYTFTFTNTGNVALSNLDIDDPDALVTGCPIATLAVGASDSCTGTRVITQAQIDTGAAILNTAVPSAEDPSGTAVPEDNTADNTTTTTVDQTPSYNMVKTSDSATMNAPGTINYTFTFTNTGNVALSNLDIDDPDAVVTGCPITTLAVGASDSCTGTRVITQAQIDAGAAILNTATPSAEDPLGTAAPEDNTADNTTTTTVDQTPGYNMVKTSDSETISAPGTINYTFTFTNTGNVALSNLDIDDPNAVVTGCPIATLAVGASDSCTGTRVITQAQIDAGVAIPNTATPSAEDPLGTAAPEDNTADNTTTTTIIQTPSYNMVKNSDTNIINAPGTINYTFTFTNTGNVVLSNLDIDDPNAVVTGCPIATLAVGTSESCTGTRVITQTQIDAGEAILNTATSSALDPAGGEVLEVNLSDNTVTTVVEVTSHITVIKSDASLTDDADSSTDITLGDTLSYSVTATNDGNTTLNNVVVSDPKLEPTSFTCLTVAPNASCVLSGTHVIDIDESNAGNVVNTASVVSDEITTSVSSNTVTTPVVQTLEYTMAKTSDTADIGVPGVITYTFTFTNTGNVDLTELTVEDTNIDTGTLNNCPIARLAPGEIATCTATRTISSAQISAGDDITNTAIPSAKGPDGITSAVEDNTANDNTTTTTVTTWADVSVTKTLLTTGPYTSGQVITYEIVVTNSASSWSDATNVVVNDLPTNLNVTNVSSTNCSAFPCTIPLLNIGDSETITVEATAP